MKALIRFVGLAALLLLEGCFEKEVPDVGNTMIGIWRSDSLKGFIEQLTITRTDVGLICVKRSWPIVQSDGISSEITFPLITKGGNYFGEFHGKEGFGTEDLTTTLYIKGPNSLEEVRHTSFPDGQKFDETLRFSRLGK